MSLIGDIVSVSAGNWFLPYSRKGLEMFNSGYNGRFDRQMRPIRDRAKQEWEIGSTVNVGFMKGLEVMEKRTNGEYLLKSLRGAFYVFQPHLGIYAI